MGKRGSQRPRCRSCGRFYRTKCRNCNSHHTWPTSRGGFDGSPNEVERDRKNEHEPWHNLSSNLRVAEVITLILNNWDTFNPHIEKKDKGVELWRLENRIKNWNLLFGKKATKCHAIGVIIKKFTRLNSDRERIRKILNTALANKKICQKDYQYLIKLLDDKTKE